MREQRPSFGDIRRPLRLDTMSAKKPAHKLVQRSIRLND
jgi:hypothetical protein